MHKMAAAIKMLASKYRVASLFSVGITIEWYGPLVTQGPVGAQRREAPTQLEECREPCELALW